MGGALGFVYREANGKVHRTVKWTNGVPWLVDNIRLVHKDQEHLNLFKKHDKDYDRVLAPVEYGLTLVDCRDNRIIDMNDYHHVTIQDGISLKLEIDASEITTSSTTLGGGKHIGRAAFEMYDTGCACARFNEFFKDGRIEKVEVFKKKWKPCNKPKTLDDVLVRACMYKAAP